MIVNSPRKALISAIDLPGKVSFTKVAFTVKWNVPKVVSASSIFWKLQWSGIRSWQSCIEPQPFWVADVGLIIPWPCHGKIHRSMKSSLKVLAFIAVQGYLWSPKSLNGSPGVFPRSFCFHSSNRKRDCRDLHFLLFFSGVRIWQFLFHLSRNKVKIHSECGFFCRQ